MFRFWKSIVLLACLLPFCATATLFGAQEFTLSNGLQVAVIPNHKAPVVKTMLWYKVGSLDESSGKGGLAHLLEHLMFRGTKFVPNSDFNDIVAQNGAESNAFTSHDVTVYHEFSDISRLEAMLALEADRMANLDISDEAFESERAIVAQERKQRISNNPSAMFAEELNKIFWKGKTYGRPVSGTLEEIADLNRQDAEAFYRRYYTPENAVLVLAGDLSLQDAQILAKKYFAHLKPRASAKNTNPTGESAAMLRSVYRFEQASPQVQTPRIIKLWNAPSALDNLQDALALELFTAYLGRGDNAYLNRSLVWTGKAVSADASYTAGNRTNGVFRAVIVPNSSEDIKEAEDILTQALAQALEDFDADALEKEKATTLAHLVYVNDNPEDAAMMVGEWLATGQPLAQLENYPEELQAVRLEDVQRVVREVFDSTTAVTGILRPMPTDSQEKK